MLTNEYAEEQDSWLDEQFQGLTIEYQSMAPSVWATERRYLPKAVTTFPGPYSFELTPYLEEILDCFDPDSPIREVAVMKGVQTGLTTALENVIGYQIDAIKTAPCMLATATLDLARARLDGYIIPMLDHSGLKHLIKSSDEGNNRKTGKSASRLEWMGGGKLLLVGAQSPSGLRSHSIQNLFCDEVDGWPNTVGKDGDPIELVKDRTAAFEASRKIFYISTPLMKETSKIERLYLRGDQSKYLAMCLRCNAPQELRWSRTDNDTGELTGFTWDMDGDKLVPGSARYLCRECSHPHYETDKPRFISKDNCYWKPTATPVSPDMRSFLLPAFYSPVGMQSWSTCVQKWLNAWDMKSNQIKDSGALQVFYNNVLAATFQPKGKSIKFRAISHHRRQEYAFGQIPNVFCERYCGGPVRVVTCAVDVHDKNLKVGIVGWCPDKRPVLIDYKTFEGETDHVDNPDTWGRLETLLCDGEWIADNGARYIIDLTLIDSGDGERTDTVYTFVSQFAGGVFAIKGTSTSQRAGKIQEFTASKTTTGLTMFLVTTDIYKDRIASAMRREWNGVDLQPYGHFNAPRDITDDQLKELTSEYKAEIRNADNQVVGYTWKRPSGAANELFDILVYNSAAIDIIAWDYSKQRGFESTDWGAFWASFN